MAMAMGTTSFIGTLNAEDLVKLRALIVADPTALGKWAQFVDHIPTTASTAADKTRLKKLLRSREAGDIEDAVLQSLQLLRSAASFQCDLDEAGTDLLELLRNLNLNSLAEKVEDTQFGDRTRARRGLWFDMGEVVQNFTGRRDELDRLHILLTETHTRDSMNANTVCIGGLGGVGKSMLARKYAYEKHEFYDGNVVWINAESYDSMSRSFTRLAVRLGVPIPVSRAQMPSMMGNPFGLSESMDDKIDEDEEFIKRIYAKLSGKKCLFIFDNVSEKPNPDFEKFKPKITNPVDGDLHFLLVTSRRSDFAPLTNGQLNLDVLREDEATQLIIGELPGSSPDHAASLSQKLQALPLALQQALAYIKYTYLDAPDDDHCIPKYLEEFEASAQKLLADTRFQESDVYAFTVLTTWDVTLKSIQERYKDEGVSPVELINYTSYLNPDRISIQFLNKLVQGSTESSLNVLKRFSMITAQAGHVSIHRLVQHVVRTRLTPQEKEVNVVSRICKCIEDFMDECKYVPGNNPLLHKHLETVREVAAHGISLFPYQVKHELLSRDFQYLQQLFNMLGDCRHLAPALSMAKQGWEILIASHGENHPSSVTMQVSFARALIAAKRTPENTSKALEILERVVLVVKGREFDPNLARGLMFDINLSMICIYSLYRNYAKVLPICDEYERNFPSGSILSPDQRLLSLVHLGAKAVALAGLGRVYEALQLAERVAGDLCQNFGPSDILSISASLYVGIVVFKKREYIRALEIFDYVYNGYKVFLGEQDPAVIEFKTFVATMKLVVHMQLGLKFFAGCLRVPMYLLSSHKPPGFISQVVHGLAFSALAWAAGNLNTRVERIHAFVSKM